MYLKPAPISQAVPEYTLNVRKLTARRVERGLQQVDLAKLAGVSIGTICNLEAGCSPRLQAFIAVCRALNVEAKELLTEAPPGRSASAS